MPDLMLLPISDDDLPFLRGMLYEAAFWRGGVRPWTRHSASRISPATWMAGDVLETGGLVAYVSDVPAGAAWVRLFSDEEHGYGFVDEQTPELSVAVAEEHRRFGIGRCLVIAMLTQARLDGADQVSLSVEQLHLAVRGGMGLEDFYRKLGWQAVGSWPRALRFSGDDYRDEVLMWLDLTAPSPS